MTRHAGRVTRSIPGNFVQPIGLPVTKADGNHERDGVVRMLFVLPVQEPSYVGGELRVDRALHVEARDRDVDVRM